MRITKAFFVAVLFVLFASFPVYAAETALTSSAYHHEGASWSPDSLIPPINIFCFKKV